jgi:catalase
MNNVATQPVSRVEHSTPGQLVDALNAVFARQQPGVRAAHAKGINLEGAFRPSRMAALISKAPHLQKMGVPITVRFSNFPGAIDVPDTDGLSSPRGMSIKFFLPDGTETDIVAHSFNGFPASTADGFRQFLIAVAASGPNAAKPTPLDAFLGEHPAAKTFLETQIPPPVSYATVSYFGVNAFRFINASGVVTYGRYQICPMAGEQSLTAMQIAKADPNYLFDEIRERVSHDSIRFKLMLQIAEDEDDLNDPSVAWPDARRQVELGDIEIDQVVADNAKTERRLLFIPGALPAGIEAQDPMIKARSDAYPVSYDRRS